MGFVSRSDSWLLVSSLNLGGLKNLSFTGLPCFRSWAWFFFYLLLLWCTWLFAVWLVGCLGSFVSFGDLFWVILMILMVSEIWINLSIWSCGSFCFLHFTYKYAFNIYCWSCFDPYNFRILIEHVKRNFDELITSVTGCWIFTHFFQAHVWWMLSVARLYLLFS